MNYSNIKTAAEIINAFRDCNNAGEQIDLFNGLAKSNEPPVDAFVEILQKIKIEVILALTIQAFSKITNAEIKEKLKQSEKLLIILSEQAQSGSSDLIRWSAATTIETLGFDFILQAQYLKEESKIIADRIMQAQLKRLDDKNLLASNNFDEYLDFWIYADSHNALSSLKLIKNMTHPDVVVAAGDVYLGKVVRIIPIGAHVKFLLEKEGFLHISQLSDKKISKVEDEVNIGDEVIIKVREVDQRGKYNLTRLGISPNELEAIRSFAKEEVSLYKCRKK